MKPRGYKMRVPTMAEMEARNRARILPVGRAILPESLRRPRNDAWKAADPEWAELREDWLKEHPRCQAHSRQCVGTRNVHHVGPRHLYPELKYHRGNLITLCEYHHFTLGHGSDPQWLAWLPNVRQLAEESRLLWWTSYDLIKRAERERIFERRPFEVKNVPSVPAKSRAPVAVLALALAVFLGGCAHGPGVKVTLTLAPPSLAVEITGPTTHPQEEEPPAPAPAPVADPLPDEGTEEESR